MSAHTSPDRAAVLNILRSLRDEAAAAYTATESLTRECYLKGRMDALDAGIQRIEHLR